MKICEKPFGSPKEFWQLFFQHYDCKKNYFRFFEFAEKKRRKIAFWELWRILINLFHYFIIKNYKIFLFIWFLIRNLIKLEVKKIYFLFSQIFVLKFYIKRELFYF